MSDDDLVTLTIPRHLLGVLQEAVDGLQNSGPYGESWKRTEAKELQRWLDALLSPYSEDVVE